MGFSRGAALALDFANKMKDDGIRPPGTKQVVKEQPQIRFLGLWDIVGSFGIPINVGLLPFQEINFGHKLMRRTASSTAFTRWRWMSGARLSVSRAC